MPSEITSKTCLTLNQTHNPNKKLYMFLFRKILITLFIFFCNQHFIYADRLLIGVNQNQIKFTEDKAVGDKGIKTCNDSSPDFNKECLETNDEGYNYKYEPNLSLELTFGEPSNFGLALFINLNSNMDTLLYDYPKNNVKSIVTSTTRSIGIPIYFVLGDKNLGANGDWSLRLGIGPGLIYFNPLIIETDDGQSETLNEAHACTYIQISWDWSWFSLSYDMFQNYKETVFKNIKNNSGEPAKMRISYNSYKYSYAYYF